MSKADKKMELVKKLQEEQKRRTKIENEAIQLICNGEFEKATALVNSIDDSIIYGIWKELEKLDSALEVQDSKSEYYKMAEARMKDIVEYRKSVTVDDPNAYAEAVLKFEGLTDKKTEELRQIFNKFYAEVETIVHKETSPW